MLNIVIFGAPGSGKGTQSELIVKKYGLVHCSTGDLLRAEIANATPLGLKVKNIIARGELVPDTLIIDLLSQVVEQQKATAKGFIFDGFPRTTVQAEALEQMLKRHGEGVTLMLALTVEKQELIKRLLHRGEISGRADDNMETIKQRIEVYEQKTAPVMDFYKKAGLYNEISNDSTVEACFEQVCRLIDRVKA